MNNYDEKIENIKETQKQILELAKTKIENEDDNFNFNTKFIVDVINYEAKVTKKYEAIVKAQKLIEEYTNIIKNSSNIDEIIEVRKKLNSCINKVKREMKNRGFDDIEINKYCEDVKKYRNCISENIRLLKRKDKINEIESLNSNIDNLNEEELLRLKKLVKNEISYGRRKMKTFEVYPTTIIDEDAKPTIDDSLDTYFSTCNEDNENDVIYFDNEINESADTNNQIITDEKKYDNIYDYVDDSVDTFDRRYEIKEINGYSKNIVKNLVIFTKNLPKMFKNKSKEKLVARDYCYYFAYPELLGYGRYIRENNSVFHNMKLAITKPFARKEQYYYNEHEKCVDWIIKYCQDNNLAISYEKILCE